MKKIYIYIIAVLFLYGCEKDYNSVVEPENHSFQVIKVEPVQPLIYFPGNTTLLKIQFASSENIKSVNIDFFSPAGEKIKNSPQKMSPIENNTYTYSLRMENTDLSGTYLIKYYVTDIAGNAAEAALQKFNYNNGSANTAPVIQNVFIDPDTMVVTDTTLIRVTAAVADSQGLGDIEQVHFITYRPDGSTSGLQFILNDDGVIDPLRGLWDETANDGIYSLMISVNQNSSKGTWRFEFTARDRNNLLSNIVSYNVLIQ